MPYAHEYLIFRSKGYMYHFYVVYQKELAFDPVEYFAEPQNRDLGIVKRSRKPRNRLVSPFAAKTRSPEQFFFQHP